MNSKKDHLSSDLFAEAMQQVQPIEKKTKIASSTTTKKLRKDIHNRAAICIPQQAKQGKSTLMEDGSAWVLRANGVAPDVLKKLSTGQLNINHSIDLHGMTREQAILTLEHTLQSSIQTSARVLCIIHGRGLHSPDGQAVLKKSVYQWLKEGPMSAYVLAVTPAPNTAGGSCLVLLRRDKHK